MVDVTTGHSLFALVRYHTPFYPCQQLFGVLGFLGEAAGFKTGFFYVASQML